MNISVLGAGSWGSALAIAFSHVADISLWSHDPKQVESIKNTRVNIGYLPEHITFPTNIYLSNSFEDSILKSELIVIATPISALRQIIQKIQVVFKDTKTPDIIWVCKGFEPSSGKLPHKIVEEEYTNNVPRVGALLGPSFAKEVALSMPTAITLASQDLDFAMEWAEKLKKIPNFRIYAHDDLIGAEVGAGVKNIMAIAVGICDGLNLGYNARAGLITRSLNELGNLVLLLGGKNETIYGLTGIGDLILTCTGDLSRNRTVGLELAKGYAIDQVVTNLGHVAEGVNACREVYNLSKKLNIDMPIVEAVYKIMFEKADLLSQVKDLLSREPKIEFSEKGRVI